MPVAILLIRPRPAAEGFAERLRARLGPGTRIVISPVLRIEHLPDAVPDLSPDGTLVLTSAHAAQTLAKAGAAKGARCYCVGAATAAAARAAGLDPIDGGGTAETLLARILADRPASPLHYLRGTHVASDLARLLSDAGLETVETVIYRQVAEPLSAEARALLGGADPLILPVFSPRSARLFFAAGPVSAPLYVVSISANAADCVPSDQVAQVTVAATPDSDAMLETIAAIASQAKRVESGNGAQ